jgi:hypothetical protein
LNSGLAKVYSSIKIRRVKYFMMTVFLKMETEQTSAVILKCGKPVYLDQLCGATRTIKVPRWNPVSAWSEAMGLLLASQNPVL